MYEIYISHEAEKYYNRLDHKTKQRINKSIANISKEPFSDARIKRLHGKLEGKYRYALGDIRIVYVIDAANETVNIHAIGRRGDIYKR